MKYYLNFFIFILICFFNPIQAFSNQPDHYQLALQILKCEEADKIYNPVYKLAIEGISGVRHIYGPAEYILLGSPSLALSLTGGPANLGKKVAWDAVEGMIKMAFQHPEKVSKSIAKSTYDMGIEAYRENYKLYKSWKNGNSLLEAEMNQFLINWYIQRYMVASKRFYNDITEYEQKDDFKNPSKLALQQLESLALKETRTLFGSLAEFEVEGLFKATSGQFMVLDSVIQKSAGLGIYPPYQTFCNNMREINDSLKELNLNDEKNLSESLILNLFSKQLNQDNNSYDIRDIGWTEGTFSKNGLSEALVSFSDSNQPRGASPSEIWLLQFEDKWTIVKKIAEGHTASYKIVDVNADGLAEILVTVSFIAQGYINTMNKLLSLKDDSILIMYSSQGFNNTGAMVEGEALRTHEFQFVDVIEDDEGLIEMIVAETTSTFRYRDSNYVMFFLQKKRIVYGLFLNESFIPVKRSIIYLVVEH